MFWSFSHSTAILRMAMDSDQLILKNDPGESFKLYTKPLTNEDLLGL